MDLITLAIPVYNVEECVERALLSALNQTYPNIDYLIVDDRGPDKSMDVVRKTIASHPRGKQVRVIENPENLGTGIVRNVIIEQTRGKYLFFLDSDDEITLDCIQKLYDEIKRTNEDVVSGSHNEIRDGEIIRRQGGKQFSATDREGIIMSFFDIKKFFAGPVNKLFNVAFLRENNIRFIHLFSEDIYFSFAVLMNARSYRLIPDVTYSYIMRSTSFGGGGQWKEHVCKSWVPVFIDILQYLQQSQTNTALRIKIKKKLFGSRLNIAYSALKSPYKVQHYINDYLSPALLKDKDTLKSPVLLLAYIFSLMPFFIKKQGVKLFSTIKNFYKKNKR
ncbi:MAG: glycosyltransferase [Dysgonamonadaceae bacterium]|jgi:glycosyltransferase involved in cell wall biosynthesis|nr:glycosyltransferase [Dysgonamonadaceae bacterium]